MRITIKQWEHQKMKTLTYLFLSSTIVGCGAGKGGSTGNTPESGYYTMTVEELPECSEANNRQLVYAKDTGSFHSCEGGSWVKIDIEGEQGEQGVAGAAGQNGLRIVENKLISNSVTNICTEYSAIEACYFNGGQLLKYSDGSILINGTYSYIFYYDGAADSEPEYDRLANSVSLIVPPEVENAFVRLDWGVSRGGVPNKNLFLVYFRSTHSISIVFDTNGDLEPDGTDEEVLTPVLTSW